jgi:WD40 repeat protein
VKVLGGLPSNDKLKAFTGVDFLPDGKRVLSSGTDGRVRTWDIATGQLTAERNGGFSPDGRRTVRAVNGLACVFDTSEPDEYSIPRSLLFEFNGSMSDAKCAVFSPNGRYVAVSDEHDFYGLWSNRRPEWWWGIAWLPEFWVALLAGGGLLVIAIRNLWQRPA